MKIVHLVAAGVAALCSKLLCSACLFLLAESEVVLSTVAFGLSAIAAILAGWFLDATLGFPVLRTVLLLMGMRPSETAPGREAR
jgi:hypothetical protein